MDKKLNDLEPGNLLKKLRHFDDTLSGCNPTVIIEGELTVSSPSLSHRHQGVDFTILPPGIPNIHQGVERGDPLEHHPDLSCLAMERDAGIAKFFRNHLNERYSSTTSTEREKEMADPRSYGDLVPKILELSTELNIFNSGYITGQYLKLIEKVGELAGKIHTNDIPGIKSSVGNIQFLLINITKMNGGVVHTYVDKALRNIDNYSLDEPKSFNSAMLISLLGNVTSSLGENLDSDGKYIPMKLPPMHFIYVWNNTILALTEIGNHFGFTPTEALSGIYNDVKSALVLLKK